jgi:acetyltransferase-like isoleucine patch superfamily enzyme
MAVFDDGEPWERKLLLFPHRINWRDGMPNPLKADAIAIALEPGEPLQAECQHFLDCVEIGATPRTDGREGLRILTILTRASASLQSAAIQEPHDYKKAKPSPSDRFPKAKIHESAYVDDGVEIGDDTAIWHFSHVLSRVKIGPNCVIGQNVVIGPDVTIGKNCKIQNNVSVYKGVMLEDGVFCGPSCVFTNVNNPRAEIERKSEFRQTLVKRGTTIGANATIVCGHVLGEYCFIAAGSVVTANVPAFALMAGVPARRIGWIGRHGEKLGPDLVCPATGRRYREIGPDQLEEISEL